MKKEYLDLKLDFMFKQLFGQPNRKHITIAFLNDILGRKGTNRIIDLTFENTEKVKDRTDGKTVRFDVTVLTTLGERINVEVQIRDQQDMPERTLYYWSRMFSSSLSSGDSYTLLPPTIFITIVNYPLFPSETDRFHTKFHIREDEEGFLWSDKLEFHLIDLSSFMVQWKKYRRKLKEQNEHELPWLMMLTAADAKRKILYSDILAELEEWAMNIEEVREALIEWENLSADKKNRAEYEVRLRELRDQLSNLQGYHRKGKEEGIKEGIKLGVEKGKKEGIKEGSRIIVSNLRRKGLSTTEIAELTGLTEDEIRELLKQGDS
ncbi:Rpn family recombination-promoting nuclease/putative transposase [Bacillus sp. DNRA2]|uniref:Rpn family recombination-promoting nuclease/putative transposase n=1 Tax=Bacillus sp. DNRA2 TaxID=2723053 RepID=UPI00145E500A|nr:Rpn family recombination-promoting nuclease/putative transposase [Bacillus sp. DNRA2]NMD72762.1 Rpn family recombination-promoting nuclease/putative transposase [Bacillus sp. DNRA2]